MRCILFNKPYGVLSQFTREQPDHVTLADHIAIPNVYPAGRLDHDSEGLLLLTDNGELQHRLTDPKFAHPRTYLAQVERIPDDAAMAMIRTGVMLRGRRTLPATVRLLEDEPVLPPRTPPIRFRKNVPTAWIEIKLIEGRNRQVRRMTAAVGHPTLRLVRTAIGTVTLGQLAPGEWRDLTPVEYSELG